MRSHVVLAATTALSLALVAGCARKQTPAPPPKSDIVERMFAARAANHGFRPPGVARILELTSAHPTARADSTTPLAVWIEVRRGEEGGLLGIWSGDTTVAQVAGGTSLRGFARPEEAGAELLALARAESTLFAPAAGDLEPPGDGQARIWVVTPAGVRRRIESLAQFVDPERRSTPFLQEARLFTRTSLGGLIEFESSTAATIESLGVTPTHTAERLARAIGIDPAAEH
jgi:hypothetical protein